MSYVVKPETILKNPEWYQKSHRDYLAALSAKLAYFNNFMQQDSDTKVLCYPIFHEVMHYWQDRIERGDYSQIPPSLSDMPRSERWAEFPINDPQIKENNS